MLQHVRFLRKIKIKFPRKLFLATFKVVDKENETFWKFGKTSNESLNLKLQQIS